MTCENRRMTCSAGRIIALTAALLPLCLVACGDDANQRSEANYCTQVGNHLSDLNSPAITKDADIDRVLSSWRAVAGSAPLAIESEWDAMVANLETAVTVDPNDPASMQKVADTARSSEPAANRVIAYTQQKCGAVIGEVAATPATPSTTTSAASTLATDTAATVTATVATTGATTVTTVTTTGG